MEVFYFPNQVDVNWYPDFFKLRFNSYTIKFTAIQYIQKVVQSSLILKHFYHQKKKPYTLAVTPYCPIPPSPRQALICLVTVALSILDISCRWNPTLCSLCDGLLLLSGAFRAHPCHSTYFIPFAAIV